jgi:hypothetical protein
MVTTPLSVVSLPNFLSKVTYEIKTHNEAVTHTLASPALLKHAAVNHKEFVMARKPIKKRASIAMPDIPKPNKHQKMLNKMHDALYALDRKISPAPPDGTGVSELIPKALQPSPQADITSLAKGHVETLHKAFVDSVMKSGKPMKDKSQKGM